MSNWSLESPSSVSVNAKRVVNFSQKSKIFLILKLFVLVVKTTFDYTKKKYAF